LAEVVHDTERLLRVTLPPAIELHMQLQAGLPPVLADATQVEQALLNLCTNAVHAIQSQGTERGSIHVEAAAVQPDQRLSERLGLAPVDYVALTVRDSGPGMDAATLERIFEPFFTTKPVGQGTGLGLAVVHGVMRTHEGAVDVQSTPGQGSRFTLYFPIATSAAHGTLDAQAAQAVQAAPASTVPSTPTAADAPGSAPRKKHHVMYVDDDQALVFLVQRLLRRRGYEVSGYTDPHEATAALRAAPQAFDLLVTDYNMPGFCGVDLVREARLIRPDLPVALASGYVTAEIEQAALAEGAQALIHKPNDVEELCATVQRLVGGDSHAAG
jgi:CheY-like chemotaxis protein/anti-sigma regulatory factor (Ser/Thr protein kinase)